MQTEVMKQAKQDAPDRCSATKDGKHRAVFVGTRYLHDRTTLVVDFCCAGCEHSTVEIIYLPCLQWE